ncbi:MAG TPA: hypothetical protein DD738_11875 [Ruminiclostridium sp.]|nr:hypothetical protein [Ruminiclostridium sp.]
MFCNKCGNELPEGESVCTSCGSTQISPTAGLQPEPSPDGTKATAPEAPAFSQMPEEPHKQPKTKRPFIKVFIGIILALVLLSGITVLGYYTFLPAKPTLLVAEYFTGLKSYKILDKRLTLYHEKVVKPRYENSVKKDHQLSLSTDTASLGQFGIPADMADMMLSALHNISLKYGYSLDLKNKKETVHIGADLSNAPILTANLYLDDTKFGLGLPQLFQKTIIGDFKNLDKLAEVFPDLDPEILEIYENTDPWISARLYDELKIDRNNLKKFMSTYGKELITNIDSRNMSIKRGQSTEILNKNVKCQEVTIVLDQAAQKKIFSGMLTTLRQDKNAFDLIIGNLNIMVKILGENKVYSQMFSDAGIAEAITMEDYKEALINLESSIAEASLPEEIIVKAYIRNLEIVKYDFVFTQDQEEIRLTLESSLHDLSFEQKMTLSDNEDNSASLVLSNIYEEASDTSDFNMLLNIDTDRDENSGNVHLAIASLEDLVDGKEVHHTLNSTLSFDMMSYDTVQQGEITLALEGTNMRKDKNLVTGSNYTGDLRLKMPNIIPGSIYIGFALDTTAEYGQKVEIPELSKEEVLDIAVAEQEDYERLTNEAYEKIGSFFTLFNNF